MINDPSAVKRTHMQTNYPIYVKHSCSMLLKTKSNQQTQLRNGLYRFLKPWLMLAICLRLTGLLQAQVNTDFNPQPFSSDIHTQTIVENSRPTATI